MGFLFRRVYFGSFKGSILKLRVLADAVIGKLLTGFGTGSDLQAPRIKLQNQKKEQANLSCQLLWRSLA
jgi:hypothetical protein